MNFLTLMNKIYKQYKNNLNINLKNKHLSRPTCGLSVPSRKEDV